MVLRAAICDNQETVITADPSRLRPQLWLHLFADESFPFLGAEDNVKVILRIRVRHVSPLRGSFF
jgi:hypothetical protein